MDEQSPYYDRPLRVDLSADTAVHRSAALPYTADGDDGPRLDLYRPAAPPPAAGYPTLLLLHGGPISPDEGQPWPREWRVFQDYGRLAATLGMVAIVPDLRYLGYDFLPLALSDALEGLRFVEDRGAEYALDPGRLGVWAFSGAGMLLRPFLQPGLAPGLRALLAFYPMLDLTHVEPARAVFTEEQLISLSPLGLIETMRAGLPLFLARAGLDRPGLNRTVDTFVQQALYHNRLLELHNVPLGGHGFDFQNDDPRGRATVARAFRFAATHLLTEDKQNE